MSNWVGGLPPMPKSSDGEKEAKKSGRPQKPSPIADNGGRTRMFFGGAVPPNPLKMPKISLEDLKPPPKVILLGGPPAIPKAPPPPPPPPPLPRPPPPRPSPPPPSPISPRESEPLSPPPLPTRLASVFDKPKKMKKKKKKKKKPPPRPPPPVHEEEEEEEQPPKCGTLPTIFAISHIPAARQGYPTEATVFERGVRSSRSRESEDEGPDIPPEIPSYKRANAFAAIFGKLIDVRNITEVGPHARHPTSNAPNEASDDGETVSVSSSGWHEIRSE